jgi:hypothetical protein
MNRLKNGIKRKERYGTAPDIDDGEERFWMFVATGRRRPGRRADRRRNLPDRETDQFLFI